jgi:hypothetical protein
MRVLRDKATPRANRQRASSRACSALKFLVDVEGCFYGLIQFLDLAGIGNRGRIRSA